MTVISTAEARSIAECIFKRPITDDELAALSKAEHAGRRIEGYIGYVAACHIVAAYEKALRPELDAAQIAAEEARRRQPRRRRHSL